MIEHMEWAEQGGMMAPLSLPITAVLLERRCTPPWYSVSIFNDGPNPVYVDVNRTDNAANLITPLNLGGNLVLNYEQPKIKLMYFRCAPGLTANVRIFGTW